MRNPTSKTCIPSLLAIALVSLIAGCEKSPAPEFRLNAVEWLKQEKLELKEGEHFPQEYRRQVANLMTALFGTPDDPRIPALLEEDDPANELFDLQLLKMSAGAVASDRDGKPVGLYREHCAHCHGISGDGAGPTAGFLNPYPRDFRLGKFKFKSTPLRSPPTDEDLVHIIRNGIPGTAMPSFRSLDPTEVESLIQYVKYLSIRGQYERLVISQLASLDDEPMLNMSQLPPLDGEEIDDEAAEKLEAFQDQLYEFVYENLVENELLTSWLEADDQVTEVAAAPPSFDTAHPEHQTLIDKGKTLFAGKANCVQCHGETGVGDGQTENFDDWTKDWIAIQNIDPFNKTTYQEFTRLGALRPRPIRPRNLRVPVFRGGSHPATLFRRIQNGIEGTPMPSSAVLSADEIWALVAYVRMMPYEKSIQSSAVKPVNSQSIN